MRQKIALTDARPGCNCRPGVLYFSYMKQGVMTMLKRLIALLGVALILFSCVACSSNESERHHHRDDDGDDREALPDVETFEITKAFENAMDESLILLIDSNLCYVSGERTEINGVAPCYIGEYLFLPVIFVAESLGAEFSTDGEVITVNYGDITVEIPLSGESLTVNGEEVELELGTVTLEYGTLVPAEDYCAALEEELMVDDGLILIGDGLSDAVATVPEEGVNMAFSAIRADLNPVAAAISAGGVYSGDATYADRCQYGETITIDVDIVPCQSEYGDLVGRAGSLYVEDLVVTPSDALPGGHKVTMTVYNCQGYTYGSVEVYDKNDQLVEFERVTPYQGAKDSVVGLVTDAAIIAKDMYQAITDPNLEYQDYRSETMSSRNEITVNVPEGGYIFITMNPFYSDYVALYNAVHTYVQLASASKTVVEALTDADLDSAAFQQQLVDYLVEKILPDPVAVAEIASEFQYFVMDTDDSYKPWEFGSVVESKAAGLMTIFENADFDINKAMQDLVKDILSDAVDKGLETFVTAVVPVTEIAFDSWKYSTEASNLVCLFMDLKYCAGTGGLIIEVCDWRTAYANVLRSAPEDTNSFAVYYHLGYLNDDCVPEMFVIHNGSHYGSYVEIYSYQNRQVESIVDFYGEKNIAVAYGVMYYFEFANTVLTGNLHMGYSSTTYREVIYNQLCTVHLFCDDYQAGGSEATYNDQPVTQRVYEQLMHDVAAEYGEEIQASNDFEVSEDGIREGLNR